MSWGVIRAVSINSQAKINEIKQKHTKQRILTKIVWNATYYVLSKLCSHCNIMSCCDIRNQWQCKLNWCQTAIPTTKIFSAKHRGKKPSKDLCWISLLLCELKKKKRCWKRPRSSLTILHFHFILCPHYPGLFFFFFGLLRKPPWFHFSTSFLTQEIRI